MKLYYLLEVSTTKPTQYRTTVFETVGQMMHQADTQEGWTFVQYGNDPERLLALLTTYLNMESTK